MQINMPYCEALEKLGNLVSPDEDNPPQQKSRNVSVSTILQFVRPHSRHRDACRIPHAASGAG
jgi:hypothetical protein